MIFTSRDTPSFLVGPPLATGRRCVVTLDHNFNGRKSTRFRAALASNTFFPVRAVEGILASQIMLITY